MDHALLALTILSSSPILVPPKTHADPTPHFIVEFFDQGGRRIYDPKKVAAGPQEDFCPRYKCLMVANRSRFRVTGLYLTTEVAPTAATVWEAPVERPSWGAAPTGSLVVSQRSASRCV